MGVLGHVAASLQQGPSLGCQDVLKTVACPHEVCACVEFVLFFKDYSGGCTEHVMHQPIQSNLLHNVFEHKEVSLFKGLFFLSFCSTIHGAMGKMKCHIEIPNG